MKEKRKWSTYTNCPLFVLETRSSLSSTQIFSIHRHRLSFQTYYFHRNVPPRLTFSNGLTGVLNAETVNCPLQETRKDSFVPDSPNCTTHNLSRGEQPRLQTPVISYQRRGRAQLSKSQPSAAFYVREELSRTD